MTTRQPSDTVSFRMCYSMTMQISLVLTLTCCLMGCGADPPDSQHSSDAVVSEIEADPNRLLMFHTMGVDDAAKPVTVEVSDPTYGFHVTEVRSEATLFLFTCTFDADKFNANSPSPCRFMIRVGDRAVFGRILKRTDDERHMEIVRSDGTFSYVPILPAVPSGHVMTRKCATDPSVRVLLGEGDTVAVLAGATLLPVNASDEVYSAWNRLSHTGVVTSKGRQLIGKRAGLWCESAMHRFEKQHIDVSGNDHVVNPELQFPVQVESEN